MMTNASELIRVRTHAEEAPLQCAALALIVCAGLLHASPALAGFTVGSFTKATAVAPTSQTVAHGLGETPKAVILWTDGKTSESFSSSFVFGFGVTDGTTSRSVGIASQDGVTTSNATRRKAAKALTLVQWGETVLAEADLSSLDATNFTLNWTTNNSTAYRIHFIAIGGTSVSAKVLEWTMATTTGNQTISGVGFQPDVVIHTHAGGLAGATPVGGTNAAFGLGAMDAGGNQWADSILSVDGFATSDTQRGQQTDASILIFDAGLSVVREASWVSMNSDGFTVNFTATATALVPIFSLAVEGSHRESWQLFEEYVGSACEPASDRDWISAEPAPAVQLSRCGTCESGNSSALWHRSHRRLNGRELGTAGRGCAGYYKRRRHRQDQQGLREGEQQHPRHRCGSRPDQLQQ